VASNDDFDCVLSVCVRDHEVFDNLICVKGAQLPIQVAINVGALYQSVDLSSKNTLEHLVGVRERSIWVDKLNIEIERRPVLVGAGGKDRDDVVAKQLDDDWSEHSFDVGEFSLGLRGDRHGWSGLGVDGVHDVRQEHVQVQDHFPHRRRNDFLNGRWKGKLFLALHHASGHAGQNLAAASIHRRGTCLSEFGWCCTHGHGLSSGKEGSSDNHFCQHLSLVCKISILI